MPNKPNHRAFVCLSLSVKRIQMVITIISCPSCSIAFKFCSMDGRRHLCEDKTVYKSKNLHVERRRRQKLNDRLLTLRSLVPNITNATTSKLFKKETVIEDAITYIQQLKGHVIFLSDQVLEMEPLKEEEAKPRIDEAVKFNAADEMKKCGVEEEVEMIIVGENNLMIKTVIGKKRGKLTILLEAMTGLGFVARDSSVTVEHL